MSRPVSLSLHEIVDPPSSPDGRTRVVIEAVQPQVDSGRFPIKRVAGEVVVVKADIYSDGHDLLSAEILFRKAGEKGWTEVSMQSLPNDRWRGEFTVTQLGRYEYGVHAWVDSFRSWRHGLERNLEAGLDVSVDLIRGAGLIEEAAREAKGSDAEKLVQAGRDLRSPLLLINAKAVVATSPELEALMSRYAPRRFPSASEQLEVRVERERARYSSWYEMFPRSCSPITGQHGTFQDCKARLPYISGMGFNVLYLPPIHPIGTTNRKGRNNALTAMPGDIGVPWAIGSVEGGHKSVHPDLGTLDDFRSLVDHAEALGVEIALDIALQCSPDHPYVTEHPEWFQKRPDGTIQYAENPPKRYEDIYPFDFECQDWQALWEELKGIFLFWCEQGVRIFRVDNPHTKAFSFWEWCLAEVKTAYPDAIFLAEAFTRPKVMHRLAKLGFSQSYTYFAWRNTKPELTEYFSELTQTDLREFFRPNLWPNTPDILTEHLQTGGRPAFMARLVLAATLGASYGIYGPAFELLESVPREPGSEEYLDSEKYQLRHWDLDQPYSLREFIARVNRIRDANSALHNDWTLQFLEIDNPQLICYTKQSEDNSNVVLVVVNLDPNHTHSGWLDVPFQDWNIPEGESYQMQDLLTGARYLWSGSRNYVEINPETVPAHIFRLNRRVRTEHDFDYYL